MNHLSLVVFYLMLAPSLAFSQEAVNARRATHRSYGSASSSDRMLLTSHGPTQLRLCESSNMVECRIQSLPLPVLYRAARKNVPVPITGNLRHQNSKLIVTTPLRAMNGQDIYARARARAPLFDAIKAGNKNKVLSILEKPNHVDLNHRELWDGDTFLIEAIRANQVEIVGILLAHEADPNLREIIGLGDREERLLGNTPLTAALTKGSTDIVRLLVKHGVKLAQNPYALHYSTSAEMVRFLIENGAPVDGLDSHGGTYLQTAASNEKLQEVAKLLIEKGAKVNIADDFGDTPLHRAHSVEVARLLIQKGANVNAANKKGLTPLHLATFSGTRMDLAALLIANGANVNARNSFGYSALDFLVADWYGHNYDLCVFLVAHGAVIDQTLVKHHDLVKEFENIRKQAAKAPRD